MVGWDVMQSGNVASKIQEHRVDTFKPVMQCIYLIWSVEIANINVALVSGCASSRGSRWYGSLRLRSQQCS